VGELPLFNHTYDMQQSTIAMPCNYSGWMDSTLMAQFGVVSFDWANHENSWRSRASEVVPGANDTACEMSHPLHPAGCYCKY
jgi:hypothetical protein